MSAWAGPLAKNSRMQTQIRAACLLAMLLAGCGGDTTSPDQLPQSPPPPRQPTLAELDVYAASPTNYTGWISGPVDRAPTVVVAYGAALVPGITVMFKVLDGGGRVANPVAITNAFGQSTSGDWILGNTPGTQRLGAFVGDSLRVVFTAYAEPDPSSGMPPVLFSLEGKPNILVIDSASGTPRPVTTGATMDSDPKPSPDGQSIAFLRGGQLHLMNRDGSNIRSINQPDSAQPRGRLSWSPDGRRLVFHDGATLGLSVIGVDGKDYVRLTKPEPAPLLCPGCTAYIDYRPDWSPDGTEIAFTRWEDLEFTVVWMMNSDGSNARRLGRREPYSTGYRTWASWAPVWSPQHRIVFIGPLDFSSAQGIFTMARDGSDVAVLAQFSFPPHCEPSDWSKDGLWLAMDCSSGSLEVRLLSIRTKVVTVIDGGRSPSFLQ